MTDYAVTRGSRTPARRYRRVALRALSPLFLGMASGCGLALVGIEPTALGVGLSAGLCGFVLSLALYGRQHRHQNMSLGAVADWALLYGASLASALILGSGHS
jgi:hypothetical protein